MGVLLASEPVQVQLNGPTHGLAIVEALAREHPGISYDVTIKVEHLKRHDEALPLIMGLRTNPLLLRLLP